VPSPKATGNEAGTGKATTRESSPFRVRRIVNVYSKSKFDNLPTSLLTQLREELDHG
jgi:hypothetical protein